MKTTKELESGREVDGIAIPQCRILRERLAPGFHNELQKHEPRTEAHLDPNWAPTLIHSLIEDAFTARASDIHIEPAASGAAVRFRIDGVISDVARIRRTEATVAINQLKAIANLDPVASFLPRNAHATCALPSGQLDLRVALTPSQAGEAAAIRLLDSRRLQRAIDDLGLAGTEVQLLQSWIEASVGMFLSAGPTGCGKTTTVYSLLHEIKRGDRVVVSLEDPVEYQVDGIVQVQLDERHHLNFGEGVKQMLRLDPDYLMLGEIRDPLSARAAVDAAISGRVLLSTVHSRDAVGAVTALRNWGLHDHEIAEALAIVIGQRLVRRVCPACCRTREPSAKESRWIETVGLAVPRRVPEAVGCAKCGQLGYSGRTGIFEMWRLDEADYEAILQHADEHALRRMLAEREHRPIIVDGMAKVVAGITTVSELRRAAMAVFPAQRLELPGLPAQNGTPSAAGRVFKAQKRTATTDGRKEVVDPAVPQPLAYYAKHD
jgi:general secretion pathway protein E